MPVARSRPSRRSLLAAAALLPLTACGAGDPSSTRPSRTAPRRSPRHSASVDPSRFRRLEREHHARLGVYALATDTGTTVTYRADERFAFCSTFKALAAAAVLHRYPLRHLDERVRYTRADIDSISPITTKHVATGMTIRQLCDAAIRYSDGTAGNLLMRDVGGPRGLTAYLRDLGDRTSRMDQYEPDLNRNPPHDPRTTSTPRMIAADYCALVLGDALPAGKRALLTNWLEHIVTGDNRIRAGVPTGWKVADKTGTGDYGRANDVGVVWRPHAGPLVVALMSERPGYRTPPDEALLAEATREVVAAVEGRR